jgi:hypothetical protein
MPGVSAARHQGGTTDSLWLHEDGVFTQHVFIEGTGERGAVTGHWTFVEERREVVFVPGLMRLTEVSGQRNPTWRMVDREEHVPLETWWGRTSLMNIEEISWRKISR